ncbi:hypothetical protein RF11_10181 [Thelohanellus kitauei]|uniref:Uncharacterized protein n=1 Tax=Thelohanellus kitauei TaxID=669202 RepID=A0A0C2MUG3_THEKT|nr:hypothetical protein RF11_10181 [Thelohanellus kitauei]
MIDCPAHYKGAETPIVHVVLEGWCYDCFVKLFFVGIGRAGRTRVVYQQVRRDGILDGKRLHSGKLIIRNLHLERYSGDIAHDIPHRDFLPLLRVDPGPSEKDCDFGNLVLYDNY